MLMDMLGMLIGFVAVILLLSLVVTALVQIVEQVFHLRARNLKHGLAAVLQAHMQPDPRPAPTEGRDETPPGAAELADRLVFRPGTKNTRLNVVKRVVEQPMTWIEPPDLIADLEAVAAPVDAPRVAQDFERVGGQLSKRFAQEMRVVTAIVAFLVAFAFQVSAPTLLRDLSTNPELRARAVNVGEQLEGEAGARIRESLRYENLSDAALETLQGRHPDLTRQIEEAAGVGSDRDEIVAELRTILCEDVPAQCESVVREYEEILDDMHERALADAGAALETTSGMLAQVNVVPWPVGWEFYRDVRNCAGVLVTVVLMSLGAPFWFEMLRNLLKLRDVLQPKEGSNADTRP